MKIEIESTSKIVELDGVPARIWEGKSQNGVKVICFITRIAVENEAEQQEFLNELFEQRPPSAAAEAFPLRLIL